MADFSENILVEQPAIALFEELGWETANCFHEFDQEGGSPLGRETKAEVVLVSRLRPVLEKLNPDLPAEAFDLAIEELVRDRSRLSKAQANSEIYQLIKNGIKVKIPDTDGDEDTTEIVRVIDWNEPVNNDYFLASQFWITGEMYTRRADLVGFVNGLPLVFIELKATHRRLKTAYTDNLTDYKSAISQLFWYNALIILSNGSKSKVGSVSAEWEHFAGWKKINSEGEEGIISLETMIRGTCEPAHLLDLLENYTLFMEAKGGLIKLVAKNHQYLGVLQAMEALAQIEHKARRLGVFWHTQGSGKSISMIFFSQKVLRKIPGNWTFVIVTDRQELDQQIYKNFANAGVVTEKRAQATSSACLRKLLREDHRYVFTLIHKFRTEKGEEHPVLSERSDIIVITDEAHRSQYDTLAMNMRTALPNASFIAFTGTPLIVGEERTKQVFGDYVSVYNFKQSVDDGATVPLYYENRIPELQLTNENLNEDMERLLEEAELDGEQEIEVLEKELAITHEEKRAEIESKIRYMKETDMAVVVSQSQNEIDEIQKKGLDIVPHRKRIVKEDLDTKFKDADDLFRIVFVCGMWMTGFDVPCCSTIYLDKPMRNHTLMQTIARANRVFRDKVNGLIVDYVGVFRNLQRALAIYGSGSGGGVREGDMPVKDKSALVGQLKHAIAEVTAFCVKQGVDLDAIQCSEKGFERIKMLDNAVDAILVTDDSKRDYLLLASNVNKLYKAILPDPAAKDLAPKIILFDVIAQKIRSITPPPDISSVMGEVEKLLDDSIAAEGYVIRDPAGAWTTEHVVDLSKIDFEALKARFEQGQKRIEAEKLKGSINSKLKKMVRLNRTRMDYLERFQRMIDEYNAGSMNIDEFFKRLLSFAQGLNEEEKRGISEQLTEEELAIFDLLTKPEMSLTKMEKHHVKSVGRELLDTLKREKLVLDWRKRQQSRAQVRVTIEDIFDRGLPQAYTPELYQKKCDAVYHHVYESYYGAGKSVYALAA